MYCEGLSEPNVTGRCIYRAPSGAPENVKDEFLDLFISCYKLPGHSERQESHQYCPA
eukprot:m.244539 g.244539  ORF g.244539 m.244539 type:complete len:57 (+) comp40247_c1_seq31:2389-2559(+)